MGEFERKPMTASHWMALKKQEKKEWLQSINRQGKAKK